MDLRQTFRALHETPFILPNPWDLGSARILAGMGFPALATTSAGFANSLGRADGSLRQLAERNANNSQGDRYCAPHSIQRP